MVQQLFVYCAVGFCRGTKLVYYIKLYIQCTTISLVHNAIIDGLRKCLSSDINMYTYLMMLFIITMICLKSQLYKQHIISEHNKCLIDKSCQSEIMFNGGPGYEMFQDNDGHWQQ